MSPETAVVVLVEHDAGRLSPTSVDAVTLGAALAAALEGSSAALAIATPDEAEILAVSLGRHGISELLAVSTLANEPYAPLAWAGVLRELSGSRHANAVLAPATDRGHEVLGHMAAELDLPLAANTVELIPGEPWTLTRLRWAGSVLEDAELAGPQPVLATVVPGSQMPRDQRSTAPAVTIETYEPTPDERSVAVVEVSAPVGGGVALTDAKVVVGGGRGVGSAEAFALLEEVAQRLGGAVGVSRAVTSLGWRPHREQVGQTGVRISPEIYLACGISGAIQHMVGCKSAKRILAVNTDPEAPIMVRADYAVVGDAREVLTALIEELDHRERNTPANPR